MRVILYCAVGLLSAGMFHAPSARMVSDQEIEVITGGTDAYCSKPMDDPDRPDCNECTSDGNGKYIKCTSVHKSQVHEYISGQSPAQFIQYSIKDCGLFAQKYSDAGCTNSYYGQLTCHREYSAAGTPVNAPGVSCNPIVVVEEEEDMGLGSP